MKAFSTQHSKVVNSHITGKFQIPLVIADCKHHILTPKELFETLSSCLMTVPRLCVMHNTFVGDTICAYLCVCMCV